MMIRHFKIGTFPFDIVTPENMAFPKNFLKFETEEIVDEPYAYLLDFADTFASRDDIPDFAANELLVFHHSNLEERYNGSRQGGGYFSHYQELDAQHARVSYLSGIRQDLCYDTVFSSALALEKHLLACGSLLLHCAYMERNGRAILFSAPSETGKTTQANLWKKYRGTEQINGDRALLHRADGEWHACGWPVCGSSGICINKEMPIDAIVMLSQAETNHIERLHPMKAFSQLYSQVTINRWNKEAHNKAMDLIEHLITNVPIYHLACNISEDAVICLEDALLGNDC